MRNSQNNPDQSAFFQSLWFADCRCSSYSYLGLKVWENGSEICLQLFCTSVIWVWIVLQMTFGPSNSQSKVSSQFTAAWINGVRLWLGQTIPALFIVWRVKLNSSLEESQCTFTLSHLRTNEALRYPPPSINNENKCAEKTNRVPIIPQPSWLLIHGDSLDNFCRTTPKNTQNIPQINAAFGITSYF